MLESLMVAVVLAVAGWVAATRIAGRPGTGAIPGAPGGPVVDDGQRAWTFTGSEAYHRVALGDLVRVTVNPRSRKLFDLTVTGRPLTGPAAVDPPASGSP